MSASQTVTHGGRRSGRPAGVFSPVSWNSGGSNLNLVLFQPNGRRIDDTTAASDPAIDLGWAAIRIATMSCATPLPAGGGWR